MNPLQPRTHYMGPNWPDSEPGAAIERLMLDQFPDIYGEVKNAHNINRRLGTDFRDGDRITWEDFEQAYQACAAMNRDGEP